MNAVYLKDEKFKARGKMLKKFREQLNLPLNKMGKFFLKHGVKKLGDKSYVEMEKERRKFEKKKYEDVAYAFAQEAADQKIDFEISVQELYEETLKRNKTFFFLRKIDDAEQLFKYLDRADKKKTLNLSYINPDHQSSIKDLFNIITNYLQDKFFASNNSNSEIEEDLQDFSKEEKVLETIWSANNCLSAFRLGKSPLGIFCGILPVDTIEFNINGEPLQEGGFAGTLGNENDIKWIPYTYQKSNIKKIESEIISKNYLIIYFGDPNFNFMKAVYNMPFSKEELKKLISQEDKTFDFIDKLPNQVGGDIIKANCMAKLILQTGNVEPNILIKTNFDITPLYTNKGETKNA